MAELVSQGRCATSPLRGQRETIRRAHTVHPITAVQSEYSLGAGTSNEEILRRSRSWASRSWPTPAWTRFLSGRFSSPDELDEATSPPWPRFTGANLDRT